MSEAGFHVHGPHDHAVEHATQHVAHHAAEAEHGHDAAAGLINQIAIFTAIIATVGAIFSYLGGATQANAALYKNEAAIKKTEASNQWNYYQAKSTKQSLAEVSRDLSPADKQANYQAKMDRYDKEKKEIEAEARKLEAQATEWNDRSEAQMHQHHRWAQATTVLQVSIALAAIVLLTRKKWLEWAMFGITAIGLGVGVLAAFHI